jgi:hypothetical protein
MARRWWSYLPESPVENVEFKLKVPKWEIFDRSDFRDVYTISHFWVGDFRAII